jgi:hypothetical protein
MSTLIGISIGIILGVIIAIAYVIYRYKDINIG